MQINIQARDFKLTEAIRDYVIRRLRFAFSVRDDHINSIKVRLSDINGPRGGADKRCKIQISLPHFVDIVIKDTQTDLYVAIDRAVDRARRTLDRKLARRRNHIRDSSFLKSKDLTVINQEVS